MIIADTKMLVIIFKLITRRNPFYNIEMRNYLIFHLITVVVLLISTDLLTVITSQLIVITPEASEIELIDMRGLSEKFLSRVMRSEDLRSIDQTRDRAPDQTWRSNLE